MPFHSSFSRRVLTSLVLVVGVVGVSACRPAQPRSGFDPKAQPPTSSASGGVGNSVGSGGTPPPPTPGVPTPPVAPVGAGAFVGRSGTGLVLNGKPWQFTGYDVYNAASRGNCGATIGAGDVFGSMLDRSGAGVVRVWFFQSLAISGGQRDWAAFDYVLASARARGMHVIATLTDQWGACETTGYKPAAWYQGGFRSGIDPGSTEPYLAWVDEVARHYSSNPTVMAWELVNEPEIKNAEAGPCAVGAAATLRSFVAEAGAKVKAADPQHLVSTGVIGSGQCGASGDDYQSLNASPAIDLCSYHDYGDATHPIPGDQWNGLARRLCPMSSARQAALRR